MALIRAFRSVEWQASGGVYYCLHLARMKERPALRQVVALIHEMHAIPTVLPRDTMRYGSGMYCGHAPVTGKYKLAQVDLTNDFCQFKCMPYIWYFAHY